MYNENNGNFDKNLEEQHIWSSNANYKANLATQEAESRFFTYSTLSPNFQTFNYESFKIPNHYHTELI